MFLMSFVLVCKRLAKAGGKGRRLVRGVQVRNIAVGRAAEGGDALFPLFGIYRRHRCGRGGIVLQERHRRHVEKVREQDARSAKMAEESERIAVRTRGAVTKSK